MIRLRVHVVADVLLERRRIGEIADTDAAPGDRVLVGRPDAARGRPDLALAAARLAQQVQLTVIRQDEVRLVADDQPIADRDPGGRELVDLREQRLRIDDDPVADDARDPVVENPGRQQPQHELPSVRIHGVPGVVPALVARDDGKVGREEIDNLALALVTPLRAEYRYVHGHPSRSILVQQ